MNKDLLRMNDFSKEEILDILNLADQLKYEKKHGITHHHLKGKTLGMIFEKASTRTRVSFEVGMTELGGYPLFLSSHDLQIGRGEPIQDTARVLSRYIDGIVIRTFSQSEIDTLAEFSTIPIINALTDDEHPCQVLADLMTIREYKNSFDNLNICYIGDGNNMAHSLMVGCLKVGANFSMATPKDYLPKKDYITLAKELASHNESHFILTSDPKIAISNADVVITDVYASMGQEHESKDRLKSFEGFCVNKTLMNLAKDDAIVLHCLPAHRGEEISEEILEQYSTVIFDEAENRLHAQKAVLVKLL